MPQPRSVTLASTGHVSIRDPNTGTMHPVDGVTKVAGGVTVPLNLAGQETRFLVVKRM